VPSRRCFALDLVDDAALIGEYCRMHEQGSVWPRVIDHIRLQGIEAMQIWRRDDRLFMIMETADDYPRPVSNVDLQQANQEWEALMSSFQRRVEGALPEEKWAAMHCIFDLGEHAGTRK
jgi:L-rhamnose mutarotase